MPAAAAAGNEVDRSQICRMENQKELKEAKTLFTVELRGAA